VPPKERDVPDQLDPNQPLPRWTPSSGERDPERIEVLLEQIQRLWKRNPEQRLCQLLVNLCDPRPNRLFYLEDHTVSERIFELQETGRWPSGRAHPPEWILKGERPPTEVRRRLGPVFDDITHKGEVEDDDVKKMWDAILDPDEADGT
jgi:hypothetical protein